MIAASGGTNPGAFSHAHHVLPVKFAKQFKDLGLNVNDVRFGAWWEAGDHLKNAFQYNKSWAIWLGQNVNATADDVIKYAQELSQEYGVVFKP